MNENEKNTNRVFREDGITRFGERLKTLMQGESYKSFARKLNMSDKAIRDYVNGVTYPSIDRAAQIAKMTGCSFDWLVTGNANEEETHYQAKEPTPTQQQRERWMGVLERMTPEEIDSAINNINKNGINILLPQPQSESK